MRGSRRDGGTSSSSFVSRQSREKKTRQRYGNSDEEGWKKNHGIHDRRGTPLGSERKSRRSARVKGCRPRPRRDTNFQAPPLHPWAWLRLTLEKKNRGVVGMPANKCERGVIMEKSLGGCDTRALSSV